MAAVPFRAECSPELFALARDRYGLAWAGDAVDVGGINLNVHLPDADGLGHVLRVYAPWVTRARVEFVQHVRASLRDAGLPFTETTSATDGETIIEVAGGRVGEIDRFVAGTNMDEKRQLDVGMAMLGRVHSEMAGLDATSAGAAALHPNHVPAEVAGDWVARAADIVRSWDDAAARERDVVGEMTALASTLAPLEAERQPAQVGQLVHGDFWDNNVLFDGDEIVAVLDLDFCGPRPRIDDVALTLYYTTSELKLDRVTDDHLARLRGAIDVYDDALTVKLSAGERTAFPLALARTILFMATHFAAIDDKTAQRRMLKDIQLDVAWSLALARDHQHAQDAFR